MVVPKILVLCVFPPPVVRGAAGGMSERKSSQSGGGGGTFVAINGKRNPLIVAGPSIPPLRLPILPSVPVLARVCASGVCSTQNTV